MNFENILKLNAEKTNEYLKACFDGENEYISDAEKYSLLSGGKRIRAYLVFEFCSLFGGEERNAVPFACAVEMIHSYSLIHDDLPCMDNDDYRRGKLTNHKVYGEAMAVLAGDALLTKAFSVISRYKSLSPEILLSAISVLAEASGDCGMVLGQALDILSEANNNKNIEDLKKIHKLKTGALIKASAVLGAMSAGVSLDSDDMKAVIKYAECVGVAFQIIDDVLDVVGDSTTLGKCVGSDANNDKLTYMSFYTVDEAMELAKNLTVTAIDTVSAYENSKGLVEFARYLLKRNF